MNLSKAVLGGAMIATMSLLPRGVDAAEHSEHVSDIRHSVAHLALGIEGNLHHGILQGKGLFTVARHLMVGAVAGAGMDSHQNPLFGLEALVALTGHLSEKVGVVLEATTGVEFKIGDEVERELVIKAALLGEYVFNSGIKGYAGPYVGKIGHDLQAGGTAGVIVDL